MAPLVDVNWTGGNWTLMMAALVLAASVMAILLAIGLCGCGDEKEPAKKGAGAKGAKEPSGKSNKTPSQKGSGKERSMADIKAMAQKFKITELELKMFIERFKQMDVNNSGSLTETELVEAMSKLDQPITREQATKFIKQYDKNGDGKMQLEEFLTMVLRKRKWSQPEAEAAALKAFKEFDKNGDGNISPAELCQAMAEMGDPISVEEAAEMIKMADTNKDGTISFEEFVTFWKQYTMGK